MNTGLLSGFRTRQAPWWGEQDAYSQDLKYLRSIGIANGSWDSTPNAPGQQSALFPFVIGDGPAAGSHPLVISDGSAFCGISLTKSILINTTTMPSLVGIQVFQTVTTDQNITDLIGFVFKPSVLAGSAVTVGRIAGIVSNPQASFNVTATKMVGLEIILGDQVAAAITTAVGIDIGSSDNLLHPTTTIGLRIGIAQALQGATIWGMQVGNYQSYHQGPLTIGAAAAPTASTVLDLSSTTGALLIPRMTTTQKNALTPVNGMLVYDSTLNKIQCYQGGAWTSLA